MTSEAAADRAAVVADAAAVIDARQRLFDRLAAGGDPASEFEAASGDALAGRAWVLPAVRSVPGVGKVRSLRMLELLGIEPETPLAALGPDDRRRLAEAVGNERGEQS